MRLQRVVIQLCPPLALSPHNTRLKKGRRIPKPNSLATLGSRRDSAASTTTPRPRSLNKPHAGGARRARAPAHRGEEGGRAKIVGRSCACPVLPLLSQSQEGESRLTQKRRSPAPQGRMACLQATVHRCEDLSKYGKAIYSARWTLRCRGRR